MTSSIKTSRWEKISWRLFGYTFLIAIIFLVIGYYSKHTWLFMIGVVAGFCAILLFITWLDEFSWNLEHPLVYDEPIRKKKKGVF